MPLPDRFLRTIPFFPDIQIIFCAPVTPAQHKPAASRTLLLCVALRATVTENTSCAAPSPASREALFATLPQARRYLSTMRVAPARIIDSAAFNVPHTTRSLDTHRRPHGEHYRINRRYPRRRAADAGKPGGRGVLSKSAPPPPHPARARKPTRPRTLRFYRLARSPQEEPKTESPESHPATTEIPPQNAQRHHAGDLGSSREGQFTDLHWEVHSRAPKAHARTCGS